MVILTLDPEGVAPNTSGYLPTGIHTNVEQVDSEGALDNETSRQLREKFNFLEGDSMEELQEAGNTNRYQEADEGKQQFPFETADALEHLINSCVCSRHKSVARHHCNLLF